MTVRRRRSLVAVARRRSRCWRSSSRRSRPRIRSATSRSTTTRGSASSRTAILLDIVIDQAEIPAFQARLRLRHRRRRRASPTPRSTRAGSSGCADARSRRWPSRGRRAADPHPDRGGLAFPPGVGGLSRCASSAASRPQLDAATGGRRPRSQFTDTLVPRAARLARDRHDGLGRQPRGRRPASCATTSVSARLTAYPTNLMTQALDGPRRRR